MAKYGVWAHIDSGIYQEIEAKDKDEAVKIAEKNLDGGQLNGDGGNQQILDNAQRGETYVMTRGAV